MEQYRPQELKATFSFDSPRPGEITMKPVLSYGDFSFQPVEDERCQEPFAVTFRENSEFRQLPDILNTVMKAGKLF